MFFRKLLQIFLVITVIIFFAVPLFAHPNHPLETDWVELKNSGIIVNCLNGIKFTHSYIFCDGSTNRVDGVLQDVKLFWSQVKRMRYQGNILSVEKPAEK